jgi:antitoxin MazE
MKTTVTKWGNNQSVRIPRDILDDANIAAGDPVEIFIENGAIVIKKTRPRKTIEELFAKYEGTYEPEEMSWGIPMGDEIW